MYFLVIKLEFYFGCNILIFSVYHQYVLCFIYTCSRIRRTLLKIEEGTPCVFTSFRRSKDHSRFIIDWPRDESELIIDKARTSVTHPRVVSN